MTRPDLLALAARVERATGPDRELDAEIAVALGWSRQEDTWLKERDPARHYWHDDAGSIENAPLEWTRSLDAVMTLKDPAHGYNLQGNGSVNYAVVDDQNSKRCATPALALLAAILRAMAGMA